MNSTMITGLLHNTAILLFFSMIYDYLWIRNEDQKRFTQQLFAGLILGGFGITLMLTPWNMVPGIVFDVRSVLLSVAGLFFGLVPTLVAIVVTGVYRIILGGGGMWMGLGVIISSGLIGILWNRFRPAWRQKHAAIELFAMGIIVHLVMASCTLLLPREMVQTTLKTIILPLLTIYPLATVALGLVMMHWSNNWKNRKALDESHERYDRLAEQSRAFIWEIDQHGRITYVSKIVVKVLGFTPEELMSFPEIFTILKDRHVTPDLAAIQALLSDKKPFIDFEVSLAVQQGRRIWLSNNGIPIKDLNGQFIGYRGITTDITEKKNMVNDLIDAKIQAEENDRLKTAFLNNISHELRTPMNAIMGFSDLMQEAKMEEKDHFAEIIRKGSRQLLSLIEDVVLVSRLQGEIIVPDRLPVDIVQLIIKQVEENHILSKEKDIRVICDFPENEKGRIILSDEDKLNKIVGNLLSNAFKYTVKGHVKVGYTLNGPLLNIFVEDTGMGIPEKEQQHIFQLFYRGEEAVTKAIGGTGLGLNIVSELVRLLKGKLDFTSDSGKGSRFWFSIPAEITIEPSQIRQDPAKALIRLGMAHLLVVEDEPDNFEYIAMCLRNRVKTLVRAAHGAEALAEISHDHFDLVLMDLKMPVMDGFEATKRIKSLHPGIPVIALTAYAHQGEREAAFLAGCDDYLTKPVNYKTLMSTLGKFFQSL